MSRLELVVVLRWPGTIPSMAVYVDLEWILNLLIIDQIATKLVKSRSSITFFHFLCDSLLIRSWSFRYWQIIHSKGTKWGRHGKRQSLDLKKISPKNGGEFGWQRLDKKNTRDQGIKEHRDESEQLCRKWKTVAVEMPKKNDQMFRISVNSGSSVGKENRTHKKKEKNNIEEFLNKKSQVKERGKKLY